MTSVAWLPTACAATELPATAALAPPEAMRRLPDADGSVVTTEAKTVSAVEFCKRTPESMLPATPGEPTPMLPWLTVALATTLLPRTDAMPVPSRPVTEDGTSSAAARNCADTTDSVVPPTLP